jgi:hypothetical protein
VAIALVPTVTSLVTLSTLILTAVAAAITVMFTTYECTARVVNTMLARGTWVLSALVLAAIPVARIG